MNTEEINSDSEEKPRTIANIVIAREDLMPSAEKLMAVYGVKNTSELEKIQYGIDAKRPQPLPGSIFIGHTYDVISGTMYPSNSFMGDQLFDYPAWESDQWTTQNLNGIVYRLPVFVTALPESSVKLEVSQGNSLVEYASNTASKLGIEGSYGFFNGSLEANFSMSNSRYSFSKFSTVSEEYRSWTIKIKNIVNARENLKDEIRDIIENYDCQDVFRTLGTHFIYGLSFGARVMLSFNTDTLETDSQTEFDSKITATYNHIIGKAEGSQETQYTKHINEIIQNSTRKSTIIGGDSEFAAEIFREGTVSPAYYKKWSKTVKSNVMPMDFTNDGLRPIWELAADENRRKKLTEAFKTYSKENALIYQAKLPLQVGDNLLIKASNDHYLKVDNNSLSATAVGKRQANLLRVTDTKELNSDENLIQYVLLAAPNATLVSHDENGVSAKDSIKEANRNLGKYWWEVKKVKKEEGKGRFMIGSEVLDKDKRWWKLEKTILKYGPADRMGHFRIDLLQPKANEVLSLKQWEDWQTYWRERQNQFANWVLTWKLDRDVYGKRESEAIREKIETLVPLNGYITRFSLNDVRTHFHGRQLEFQNWLNTWGLDRDRYGRDLYKEVVGQIDDYLSRVPLG